MKGEGKEGTIRRRKIIGMGRRRRRRRKIA